MKIIIVWYLPVLLPVEMTSSDCTCFLAFGMSAVVMEVVTVVTTVVCTWVTVGLSTDNVVVVVVMEGPSRIRVVLF